MLNELLLLERGLPPEKVKGSLRHQDVRDATKGAKTFRVWLDPDGIVASVSPIPDGVALWTLRNHNSNSFPFIQINKKPLLTDASLQEWEDWKKANPRPESHELRTQLIQLATSSELRSEKLGEWTTSKVMRALRERLEQISSLAQSDASVLTAALERFLKACDPAMEGEFQRMLEGVRDQIVAGLNSSAGEDWVKCAAALLVDSKGAFYIDAAGEWPRSLTDRSIIAIVSAALEQSESSNDAVEGICALDGNHCRLVSETFPQASLPKIGPTILFSRFHGRRANKRYGRVGCDTMPVGEALARRLAAAVEIVAADERKDVTWRPIPGERPKQIDLLLAFVETAPDAPVVGTVAADDGDFEDQAPDAEQARVAKSIADYDERCRRLIEALQARIGADFRKTPVRLMVLRKLDPANRKVVYSGSPTVADLYNAAFEWGQGERNIPPWATLPVPTKDKKVIQCQPPHIAPLGLISLIKQLFTHGGCKRQEVAGIPATEAMALFLGSGRRATSRILRLVLRRRTSLLSGTAHAVHRGLDDAKKFDRKEALRTVTILGVLLHKLERSKETYMNGAAFKLGQLLSAADVVHAGYCADVRGGDLPPSLLGNQVFTMAQGAPLKALSTLCRRWKPYDGWAMKADRDHGRFDAMIGSEQKAEQRKGWDIKKALRHAREMKPLADELAQSLAGCNVDDTFRAELLLGYLAAFPKAQRDNSSGTTD